MTLRRGDYPIFDPGVYGPLHEVSRKEARAHYEKLMAEKEERKSMLAELLARHGVELDGSDKSVQACNDWFRAEVEEDPANPGRLAPVWYSIGNDIGLRLGDLLIERAPNLRWEMFTAGKKDLAYQRPVIMGFAVKNPKYNVDFDHLVGVYGHQVVRGQKVEPDRFVAALRSAESKAS